MQESPNFPKDLAIRASQPPAALKPLLEDDLPPKPPNSTTTLCSSITPSSYVQDIDRFGIAGRIWEAAYLLPVYLCNARDEIIYDPPCSLQTRLEPVDSPKPKVTRQVIIELGSGTGYVGLELARRSPLSSLVILTDLPEVCPLLESNRVGLVNAEERWDGADVQVRPLPWGCIEQVDKLLSELEHDDGPEYITHIVCSDLVYFPPLLPLLLRTLLHLTCPRPSAREQKATRPIEVIISYKMRSLAFETPFWVAFGAWFDFQPVLRKKRRSINDRGNALKGQRESGWERLGAEGDGGYFVFVAMRKPESYEWSIPLANEELMYGRGDGTFESLLLLSVEI